MTDQEQNSPTELTTRDELISGGTEEAAVREKSNEEKQSPSDGSVVELAPLDEVLASDSVQSEDSPSGETASGDLSTEGPVHVSPSLNEESAEVSTAGPTGSEDVAREDGPEDKALHVGLVEAILFANGDPADLERLLLLSRLNEDQLQAALGTLKERGNSDSSGCELVQVAGKYQLRTKAMFSEYLREIKAEPPRRLSAAALETVAIVAYRQPIVRSDVEKIRGVDCTPTIKTLLERGLIKILGHQASVGQPALYGTTEEFLKLFGLNSLSELPTLRDLQELERDPGESEEVDEVPASMQPTIDTGEDIRPAPVG